MNTRNEIKAYIIREGKTMSDVLGYEIVWRKRK